MRYLPKDGKVRTSFLRKFSNRSDCRLELTFTGN